jgi:hypothetical protein
MVLHRAVRFLYKNLFILHSVPCREAAREQESKRTRKSIFFRKKNCHRIFLEKNPNFAGSNLPSICNANGLPEEQQNQVRF